MDPVRSRDSKRGRGRGRSMRISRRIGRQRDSNGHWKGVPFEKRSGRILVGGWWFRFRTIFRLRANWEMLGRLETLRSGVFRIPAGAFRGHSRCRRVPKVKAALLVAGRCIVCSEPSPCSFFPFSPDRVHAVCDTVSGSPSSRCLGRSCRI